MLSWHFFFFLIIETHWKTQSLPSWSYFPTCLRRVWKWGQAFCRDLPAFYFTRLTSFADTICVPASLGTWGTDRPGWESRLAVELIFLLWRPFLLELLQDPLETIKGFIVEIQRNTYLVAWALVFSLHWIWCVPWARKGQACVPHLWVVLREAEAASGFDVWDAKSIALCWSHLDSLSPSVCVCVYT